MNSALLSAIIVQISVYQSIQIAGQCPTPNLTSDYVVVNPPREGFAVGTKLEIACKTGYKTMKQFIYCDDNKQWTSPRRCQALECLLPGDNGAHYRGTQNTTVDGTPCLLWNIVHPPGEQFKISIDGLNHNYCRHVPDFSIRGTWCYTTYQRTRRKPCSIPICSKYCPPPDLQHTPLDVRIPKTILRTGTDLNIDCKAGYLKYRSGKITCELDGQWSDFPSGICDAINCTEMDPIHVHSSIQNQKALYKYTDVVNVVCDPGYETENGNSLTYLSCDTIGQWNGSVPFCKAINCTEMDPIHVHSSIQNQKALYKYTDVVNVICDPGYETENGNSLTYLSCDTIGQWNGSVPFCKAICKPPSLECNSRLLRNRTRYILHDAIEIECVDGFEVEGDTRFICQNDRSWNGTMPKCRPKTEHHDITKRIMTAFIGTTSGLALILIVVTVTLIFTCSRYRRRERNRPACATTNEVELANIHQYESISQYEVIINEQREPQSIYNQLTPP